MQQSAIIYGLFELSDPGRIRYVGQTRSRLRKRLHQHYKQAEFAEDSHKSRWVRSVWKDGGCVLIKVLQEVGIDSANSAEQAWIKMIGRENLANGNDGGAFVPALAIIRECHSEGTKKKIADSLLGHQIPDAVREKISKKQLGRRLSETTIFRMSSSQRLRTLLPETRAKISSSLVGHSFRSVSDRVVDEIRMMEGTNKEIADRFNVSHSTVVRVKRGLGRFQERSDV